MAFIAENELIETEKTLREDARTGKESTRSEDLPNDEMPNFQRPEK